MKKKTKLALHSFIPIYLPFLLLSIASAFLVYLIVLAETRRIITCYKTPEIIGCNYTFFKIKVGEVFAQIASYVWFFIAQLAFYRLYIHQPIAFSSKKKRTTSFARLAAMLFCISVTVIGFCGVLMLTWRIAAAQAK